MHTNIRQHGASVILRHPFQCTRTIWIWIAFVISHDFLWHFVATTRSVFVFDRLPEPVFLVLEPQTHLLNRVRVAYVCIWIFMHIAIAVVVFCWATVALLLKPDSLAGLWAGVLRRSSMDCKCKGRDGKSTETYWTPPVFDFLQHWFPSEVQRREQRAMCFCSLFGTNFRYFNPDFSSIVTRVHSPFYIFLPVLETSFYLPLTDPGPRKFRKPLLNPCFVGFAGSVEFLNTPKATSASQNGVLESPSWPKRCSAVKMCTFHSSTSHVAIADHDSGIDCCRQQKESCFLLLNSVTWLASHPGRM